MTFATQESSRELGDPIQLFKFTYGPDPGNYYAYTDSTEEQTVDGITYVPRPIQRDTINTDGTLDKSTTKISIDISTEVAELFRVYPPAFVVTLIVFQGHIGDPDSEFLVIWAGRIVAASRQGSEAQLDGEPVSTSLRRAGLRRHYQYGCPHQLYGPQCLADKASKTLSATVASVSGATVTLTAGWNGAFDSSKFLGGLFEWVDLDGLTDRRTILRVTGNTLSLSGIPKDVSPADTVSVVLGCNHKAYAEDGGDCQPLFDNILNYGGDRWIPTQNPIGNYNNYF
jgi:hypothetical protein